MQFTETTLDHMMSDLMLKKLTPSPASSLTTAMSASSKTTPTLNDASRRKSLGVEEKKMMTTGTPPTPPYRQKRPHKTPILSEILNSTNDLLPYVLQFNFKTINDQSSSFRADKGYKHFELNNFDYLEPSLKLDDYFLVEPEFTKQIESSGAGNCLFLSIARSLLYKLYFENKKYEFIMRNIYFNEIKDQFKFDSDLALQETLRKKLCLYWLGFVKDGKFVDNCKYVRDFKNVCDFVYQVYQISVNNYSDNKLYTKYAMEDLVNILNVKIFVFETRNEAGMEDECSLSASASFQTQNNSTMDCINLSTIIEEKFKLKIYEPVGLSCTLKLTDFIYLLHDRSEKIKYKWLMPKTCQSFLKNNLLNPFKQDVYYLKVNHLYSNPMIVISSHDLLKSFGGLASDDLGVVLFLSFLNECAVHTLISLNDVDFESVLKSKNPSDMVTYLNSLWGQNHFSLKEVMNKIEHYKRKKLYQKNKSTNRHILKTNNDLNNENHLTSNSNGLISKLRLNDHKEAEEEPEPINYSIKHIKETSNSLLNDKDLQKDRRSVLTSQDMKITEFYKERKIRHKMPDYFYASEPEVGPPAVGESTKLCGLDKQDLPTVLTEKIRRKSIATINDIEQQFFYKATSSSDAFEISAIPKMDESVNFKRQQQKSAESSSSSSSKTDAKLRNKTITQLGTRRSLNSCLNTLIMMANSKDMLKAEINPTASTGSIPFTSSSSSASSSSCAVNK